MRGLRRVVSVYDVNKATRLAIEAGLAKVCFGEQLMSLAGVPSVCVCACDGLPEVLPVSFPSYFLSLSPIFSIFSIIFNLLSLLSNIQVLLCEKKELEIRILLLNA